FARQILALWIGTAFADRSARILQILMVGAFVTGISWIPLTMLHAAHRPDLTAKLHLVGFPLYALALYLLIQRFGVAGAALAWSARLVAENIALATMARRFAKAARREMAAAYIAIFAVAALMATGAAIADVAHKVCFVGLVFPVVAIAAWTLLIDRDERL